MIVYRVEHSTVRDDRTGHFVGPMADANRLSGHVSYDRFMDAQVAVVSVMNDRYDKPTPHWDPALCGIEAGEICGVDSAESLEFWFEWSIPLLREIGYTVRRYNVPDEYCRVGISGQVVFLCEKAQLLEEVASD